MYSTNRRRGHQSHQSSLQSPRRRQITDLTCMLRIATAEVSAAAQPLLVYTSLATKHPPRFSPAGCLNKMPSRANAWRRRRLQPNHTTLVPSTDASPFQADHRQQRLSSLTRHRVLRSSSAEKVIGNLAPVILAVARTRRRLGAVTPPTGFPHPSVEPPWLPSDAPSVIYAHAGVTLTP